MKPRDPSSRPTRRTSRLSGEVEDRLQRRTLGRAEQALPIGSQEGMSGGKVNGRTTEAPAGFSGDVHGVHLLAIDRDSGAERQGVGARVALVGRRRSLLDHGLLRRPHECPVVTLLKGEKGVAIVPRSPTAPCSTTIAGSTTIPRAGSTPGDARSSSSPGTGSQQEQGEKGCGGSDGGRRPGHVYVSHIRGFAVVWLLGKWEAHLSQPKPRRDRTENPPAFRIPPPRPHPKNRLLLAFSRRFGSRHPSGGSP